MICDICVPKSVVGKIQETTAKILNLPKEEVQFVDYFETMNCNMEYVGVSTIYEENFEEETFLAAKLSEVLQVPVCLGGHNPEDVLFQYINGKCAGELKIIDVEGPDLLSFRFIDPPEGMTEP